MFRAPERISDFHRTEATYTYKSTMWNYLTCHRRRYNEKRVECLFDSGMSQPDQWRNNRPCFDEMVGQTLGEGASNTGYAMQVRGQGFWLTAMTAGYGPYIVSRLKF